MRRLAKKDIFSLVIILFLFIIHWGCENENQKEKPQVKSEWIEWIKQNHSNIRTIKSWDSAFSDLQFLKAYVGDRRLVQLGENGHGVSEFSKAKVRLIKFLHQHMGFEVIAFESGLFECFMADNEVQDLQVEEIMRRSIFEVWHCSEVLELFQYIKASKDTPNPLILSGFDVQISSISGASERPQVLKELIENIDPAYAQEVFAMDNNLIYSFFNQPEWVRQNGDKCKEFYRELYTWLDNHMEALIHFNNKNPLLPLIVRQSVWSMIPYINSTLSSGTVEKHNHRDKGMADNVGVLMNEIYPGKKIMIWAHNRHIQHDVGAISIFQGIQNMGYWLAQNFRSQLYTIGLFMYEGQVANGFRGVYDISDPDPDSLEAIFYYTETAFSFLDLLSQIYQPGNSWIFETIPTKDHGVTTIYMVPRDQYDAILFIKTVHPPDYIN